MLILRIRSSCDETGVALYDTESARLLAHALHTPDPDASGLWRRCSELASRVHPAHRSAITQGHGRVGTRSMTLMPSLTQGPRLEGRLTGWRRFR